MDDGVSASMPGTAAMKQVERPENEPRIPPAAAAGGEDAQQRHVVGSGPGTTVGEWNSLPVLVERLREALELSLGAAGHRRGGGGDEATTSASLTEPVDVERSRARHSLEQALLTGGHDDLEESKKDELKFLEDLLLSDIQTALSRLRETLERTDVATLAKHGGVSDPTSKLHLLRLVSSLLSRLQVPEVEETGGGGAIPENRTNDIAVQSGVGVPIGRRRRAVRHTIGVSAEEIAHARRQLEESRTHLARLSDQVSTQRRELLLPATTSSERHVEEIHDKYTKDAINQRQSLRDKNKDSHGDIGAYRFLAPSQVDYADRPIAAESSPAGDAVNARRNRRRGSVDSCREKDSDDEMETAMKKANEEQSRVTKLAAALRQRAEFLSANRNHSNNNNNKFTAKKFKIKRANTIDIPSYLKLQAANLGYDNPGCVLLRRPIDVSDKIASNGSGLAVPPSFHPKTENDKKFLALIKRNNEAHAINAAPAFVKSHARDAPSFTHENWNSRFSNIKTAFDRPSAVNEESKAFPRPHPAAKRSPGFAPQASPSAVGKRAPIDTGTPHNSFPFAKPDFAGFRHAPSSLFRKIEKSPQSPKSPPIVSHWQRENAPPRNTLREKARIMFDRDSERDVPTSQPPSKSSQKSAFPRPPWIEHERTTKEGKPSNMVTENGRLDYRSFCKQFAPFIGKNAGPESKRSPNIEESRRRGQHATSGARCKGVAPPSEKLGATNGRVPLKMFPATRESRLEHHQVEGPSTRDRFHGKRDAFEPAAIRRDKSPFDVAFARSTAVHAGVNGDARPEKARAPRAAAKVPKEPRIELDISSPLEPNYRSENPGRLILDHNRNYHPASTTNGAPGGALHFETSESFPPDGVPFRTTPDRAAEERQVLQIRSPCENSFPFGPPAADNRSQYSSYPASVESAEDPFGTRVPNAPTEVDGRDFPRASDGALPEEENIQNQDISADAGVVTRYACAIATVASADIPDARSAGIRPESRDSFSSSSSQPGSSRSRAASSDAAEDEIRRHNMLQQSLVRRLQNERTMLNDAPVMSNQQSMNSFNQPARFQPPDSPPVPRRLEPPRKLEPPIVTVGLAPSSGLNRVTALRGQYEQPDGHQSRSVQKERSPIPSDGAIDSSDEYLVSCASRPSRSIVLSKSESWHQLALSRGHHSSPRLLPPQPPALASYLPPKPKSKSPSPYRMKKQYEASSDSVKKMENKIRRYFDSPTNDKDSGAEARDAKGRRFSSRDHSPKNHGLLALSRSRTMPGICDEGGLRLSIPTSPQLPTSNLNTADVDKVFDDIFEEATKTDHHF